MEMIILLAVLSLVLGNLPGPSALPMTDYSQLNHDEPTHWTKAATTHAPSTSGVEWRVSKKQASTATHAKSESFKPSIAPTSDQSDLTTNESNTSESQQVTLSLQEQNDITTRSMVYGTNDPLALHNDTTNFQKIDMSSENSSQKVFDTIETSAINSTDHNFTTELPENKANSEIKTMTTNTSTVLPESSSPEPIGSGYNYDEGEEKPTNIENDYKQYDPLDDTKKSYTNDNEISDKQDPSDGEVDRALNSFRKSDNSIYDIRSQFSMQKFDYNSPDNFDSEQEEEEIRRDDIKPKPVYDTLALPTLPELDESYDADTPFKKWDRDSEEQEKLLENIVFQANNDTFDKIDITKTESSSEEQTGGGRWFLLLLAGNSTIVRLRQKDFAKYLKLNLAARLSLEYDEVKLNKVILAPPRLMVNVSVVPSGMNNLDEEFDLNERLFGEEEAPLHRLAETNATLLELSGEEYHVVRFLSLRSQQPLAMDEVASETSVVINDRHADIERVIYVGIGTACVFLIIPLIIALCRLYLVPMKIRWPWKRDKPLFGAPWTLPRHQRMKEHHAPIGGPLTVIYSGAFVERNGSWIEDNYQGSSIIHDEPNLENPVYGFEALEKSTVREICDPSVLESPRFNIDSKLRILGCRPNHLLIPHTPIKRADQKSNLDVRIPKGLDNPNYQT